MGMQVNFMHSQPVWPQLETQGASAYAYSQPLLPAAHADEFAPRTLGPLTAPLQLRMMNCGDCTLHTGNKSSEEEYERRDKNETDCCSMGTVREAFCQCDPFLCCYNIIHCLF